VELLALYVPLPALEHRRHHRRFPFTEPAQVPRIVAFLKKQALFYTLLASCVREQQKQYNGKLRASIFFHFLENTSFRLSNSMQTWTAL